MDAIGQRKNTTTTTTTTPTPPSSAIEALLSYEDVITTLMLAMTSLYFSSPPENKYHLEFLKAVTTPTFIDSLYWWFQHSRQIEVKTRIADFLAQIAMEKLPNYYLLECGFFTPKLYRPFLQTIYQDQADTIRAYVSHAIDIFSRAIKHKPRDDAVEMVPVLLDIIDT